LTSETGGTILTCTATNGVGLTSILSTPPIRIDLHAPNTDHSLNPPEPNGKRNWYISDVTVTLNEKDPLLTTGEAGSGVQVTRYRVNDGAWTDYNGPFVVSNESLDNKVEYYSIDKADNQEATQNFHFKLDKTPPEIKIDSGETDDIIWNQAHLEHGILANDPVLSIDCDATDNLDLFEIRAEDADTGETLDAENVHADPPITHADCSLEIPLHEGINTIDIVAEDCAGWEDAIRIQVVYVEPGRHDPRSMGFWAQALKTHKYDDDEMSTLLSYTNVASDTWGTDATRNRFGELTLSNFGAILNAAARNNVDMETKMKGQLLADWLNMVSGRLAVKKPVDVSPVKLWPSVMDDVGGDPVTYAYRVTLEIEEKVQPAPANMQVNLVSKNLAEALDLDEITLP
jgi:hypothetical protein